MIILALAIFLFVPFGIKFSILKINSKFNKNITVFSIFNSFALFFFVYSMTTFLLGMFHVSGYVSIAIFLIISLPMVVMGVWSIRKFYKEFITVIIFASLMFLVVFFIPFKPNIFSDYRLYGPMINSTTGFLNNGVDNIIYKYLTLYHFLGVFKWISMMNILNFSRFLVPALASISIAFLILKIKKFKFLSLILISLAFIFGKWSNALSFGPYFWAPLFMIGFIIDVIQRKQTNLFVLLVSVFCAAYVAIAIIFILTSCIIWDIYWNKNIKIKNSLIYGVNILLSITFALVFSKIKKESFLIILLSSMILSLIILSFTKEKVIIIKNIPIIYNKYFKIAAYSLVSIIIIVLTSYFVFSEKNYGADSIYLSTIDTDKGLKNIGYIITFAILIFIIIFNPRYVLFIFPIIAVTFISYIFNLSKFVSLGVMKRNIVLIGNLSIPISMLILTTVISEIKFIKNRKIIVAIEALSFMVYVLLFPIHDKLPKFALESDSSWNIKEKDKKYLNGNTYDHKKIMQMNRRP